MHIAILLKDLGFKFLHAVEPQEQKDFNNTAQRVVFALNTSPEMVNVMIDFFDDAINEADEGFLIVMRVDPAASNPQDIPDVILERNGVSLVTILNDDRT